MARLLRGFKDPSTDLWTLPITPKGMHTTQPWSDPVNDCASHLNYFLHNGENLATVTHSVHTRANGVKISHQLLCNPPIWTLIKAVRKCFLKGCPNLSKKLKLKYLNPSLATAMGHMKCPHHGIWSTGPKHTAMLPVIPKPALAEILPLPIVPKPNVKTFQQGLWLNFICNDLDKSITNVFCFCAFVNKHSGVMNNDLNGNFPFMFYNGSVCFLVVYHYETIAILGTPITGLDNKNIFNAYGTMFLNLTMRGFKFKLNVMDNQATKHIKKFHTKEECTLQLVKPHNHCIYATEQAIQTFKNAYITALATTE